MHGHRTTSAPLRLSSASPALAAIDTVDERLAIASGCTSRERRLGAILNSHVFMLSRCATPSARRRLELRIYELVDAIGQLMAEHAAEVDGAIRHLAYARQSARIDAFAADRYRLHSAGLSGVA